MYQDMYQQGESFMKQFNEILTLNAETMSTLCEKQAALVNSVMTESIDYAKDLPSQKSAETFFESQKAYWESMQQKISDNAKDSFDIWSEASEKITGLLQSAAPVDIAVPTKSAKAEPAKAARPAAAAPAPAAKKKAAAKKAEPAKA